MSAGLAVEILMLACLINAVNMFGDFYDVGNLKFATYIYIIFVWIGLCDVICLKFI